MEQIYHITDLSNPDLSLYAAARESLLMHYNEPNPGFFIAESPKVILRALNAGYEPISLLIQDTTLNGEAKRLLERIPEVPIYIGQEDLLVQITGFKLTRGALCLMRRKKQESVAPLLQNKKRIVILENVMNPANVGAIFRSAAALGMDGILLTPGCGDPLYRRAIRVSMGTVFQIPWAYMDSDMGIWPKEGLSFLHQRGFVSVSMALKKDSVSITDPSLVSADKLAIIMGTEGNGLCDETISHSHYTAMIPMSHDVDSLNVAAASAVAFWQLGIRK